MKERINEDDIEDSYTGKAFISLSKQSQVVDVVWKFDKNLYRILLEYLYFKVFKCKSKPNDAKWWDGNHVHMYRAAEPGEVFWENMGITFRERVKNSIIIYAIVFFFLCIAFGINFLLVFGQNQLESNLSKGQSTTSDIWGIR
jgi:hypothetical protein